MNLNIRLTGSAVLAIVAIAAAAWYMRPTPDLPSQKPQDDTSIITPPPEIPTVIFTDGGQLGVAIVTATERFIKEDPRVIWGIPMGTTKSLVQADVTYRYHIELKRRWPFKIVGKTAVIEAPEIKPSLPIAFDTATVRKNTESGWARFNKDENLQTLERSITAQIQSRANGPRYEQIKRDEARKTVRVFVKTWLLSQRKWGNPPEYKIVVLFPGETMESLVANAQQDAQ